MLMREPGLILREQAVYACSEQASQGAAGANGRSTREHFMCFLAQLSHRVPTLGFGSKFSKALQEEGEGWGAGLAPMLALRPFDLASSMQPPQFPSKLQCLSGRGLCGRPQALRISWVLTWSNQILENMPEVWERSRMGSVHSLPVASFSGD